MVPTVTMKQPQTELNKPAVDGRAEDGGGWFHALENPPWLVVFTSIDAQLWVHVRTEAGDQSRSVQTNTSTHSTRLDKTGHVSVMAT